MAQVPDSSAESMERDDEPISPPRLRKRSSLGSTPNLRKEPERDTEFIREIKKQKAMEKEQGEQQSAASTPSSKKSGIMSPKLAPLSHQPKGHPDCWKSSPPCTSKPLLLQPRVSWLSLQTYFSDSCMSYFIFLLPPHRQSHGTGYRHTGSQITPFTGEVVVAQRYHPAFSIGSDSSVLLSPVSMSFGLQQGLFSLAILVGLDLKLQMTAQEQEYESKLQSAASQIHEQSLALSRLKDMEHKLREAEANADTEEQKKLVQEKAETEKRWTATLEQMSDVLLKAENYKLLIDQALSALKAPQLGQVSQGEDFRQKKEELLAKMRELEDKYTVMLQEKDNVLTESNTKKNSLSVELEALKEKMSQGDGQCEALQRREEELKMQLQKEMETSSALKLELQKVQEEMAKESSLLEDELEGVLDELDRLQHQEEEAEKMILQIEQVNKERAEKLGRLEETIKGKNQELENAKENPKRKISELKEEHASTLCKLSETESFQVSATTEIESLKSTNASLLEKFTVAEEENKSLQQDLESKVKDIQGLELQICNLKESNQAKEDLENQLLALQESLDKTEKTLNEQIVELQEASVKCEGELKRQLLDLKESSVKTKEALEQQLLELQESSAKTKEGLEQQLLELQESSKKAKEGLEKQLLDLQEECSSKESNEAILLEAKQQQLDAFEAEKNALLSEHGAAQVELNKLSDTYAKLLGHQNPKQKIKHVMKLKTENAQLKQELIKLKAQFSKEKRTLEKLLKSQLSELQGDAVRCSKDLISLILATKSNREGGAGCLQCRATSVFAAANICTNSLVESLPRVLGVVQMDDLAALSQMICQHSGEISFRKGSFPFNHIFVSSWGVIHRGVFYYLQLTIFFQTGSQGYTVASDDRFMRLPQDRLRRDRPSGFLKIGNKVLKSQYFLPVQWLKGVFHSIITFDMSLPMGDKEAKKCPISQKTCAICGVYLPENYAKLLCDACTTKGDSFAN
ncbi:hyaluronan mediated motility receptor-like [Dendropsophus ebraccatus]|uniref:hyaluronan mediated motility receptor-like n=1 Tax=Dendropsophus ebraccatus TaxID=150705 RepID=UPI0038315560